MIGMKIMSKIFHAAFLSLPTKTAAISRKDRRSQQRLTFSFCNSTWHAFRHVLKFCCMLSQILWYGCVLKAIF